MSARLERLPLSRWHRMICALIAGALVFEFIDLYAFSFSAPALLVHQGFTVPNIGSITAATGVGAFLGAFVGGWAADRWGRKPVLMVLLVVFSLPCLVNAFVSTPDMFLILRFITAIGYQGTSVAAIVLLAEIFPGAIRGRAIAWAIAISGLGPITLTWIAYLLVPNYGWGWRALFVVGGMGLFLMIPFGRCLPESPRWLESRGRLDRADDVMGNIEAAVRRDGHELCEPIAVAIERPAGEAGRESGLRALIRGGYGKRFIVTCSLWILGVVGYFGFTAWLSTLLKLKGYSLGEAALITAIITTVGMLGLLTSTVVADRWERKYTLAVVAVLICAVAVIFTTSDSTAILIGLGCILQVLFHVTVPLTNAYSSEVFPTQFRSVGSGWASSSSRIANIFAPLVISSLIVGYGISAVFYFIAAVMAVMALVMALFGESTKGVSLEAANKAPSETSLPAVC
ncbi:MFS transporter [Rhodococcus pseudokoreensis]|uniref:MFS transporter n=1 Tax=Rhodococcus pseudokoreensis TaxID=2811421 RepID=A0A974WAT4_9NOCA|nr:MFS transporter [Rhodococcus pseudokoreensis]QSE93740.1 MFS transporter [Rhodococcus pseudokoreensis]